MKKRLLAFLMCLVMLFLTGCTGLPWDTDEEPEEPDEPEVPEEPEEDDEPEEPKDPVEPEEPEEPAAPERIPVPALTDYSSGSSVGATSVTTSSGKITGATKDTVPRPDHSGRMISSERYLSPKSSGTQNIASFKKLLKVVKESYATENPITLIDIPKGTYRFKSSLQYAINLSGMKNLAIEGNGSSFIFEDSDAEINSAAYFGIDDADTIELRNFSVDFDWSIYPLFVIGKVTAASTTDKSVTFRIDSHSLPSTVKIAGGRTWDPALDNRSETVGFVPSGSITKTEVLDAHTLRVTYSSVNSAKNAKLGDCFQFYLKPNFNATGFRSNNTKNLTLNNLTIYSTPYEAAHSTMSDGYHIIDCKVIPAEGRRFTTYSGFETHAVKGLVILEGCHLEGILDDNMHLSNHFMGGENVKVDNYTVDMKHLQTWTFKCYLIEGAKIKLYDSNFNYLNWSSTIVSVSKVDEGQHEQATYTVKFKDALPATIPADCKFISDDFNGATYIIRKNTFKGGLCHALYIGLGNGTIENNTFHNFAYPSLILTSVNRWDRWFIGYNVQNVVIKNNTMTKCNTAQRDPSSFAVVAGVDKAPSDFTPINAYVIKNILVEKNTVDGSTGAAFSLFGATDVIVRNNSFLNSNTLPTVKARLKGWGNVYICNAQNITYENNTIKNTGTAYENGLYVQTSTVKNSNITK